MGGSVHLVYPWRLQEVFHPNIQDIMKHTHTMWVQTQTIEDQIEYSAKGPDLLT